jgi:endonuclease I
MTDCEQNNGKVSLIYTKYSATMNQWNGWNREHVWPQSLGGNNTSGGGADLHHIRPSDAVVNSTRGNKKYGNVSGGSEVYGKNPATGYLGGTSGGYFEPNDNVKGDVARICLYVHVRWGSDWGASNITSVFESIDVLLQWCELDPVDTWELGRNEVVEAYQGNRNVFIDYPELAWLLFGEEVPDNMVTPSGIAKNGTQGGSNNNNNNNDNNGGNTDSGNNGNTDSGNNDNTGNNGNTGSGNTDSGNTTCEHKNTIIVNEKAATCDADGYSGDTECRDCRTIISTGKKIHATGHEYGEEVVTKEATEDEEGESVKTCSKCGDEIVTVIPVAEPDGFFAKLIAIFKEFFASIAELFGMGD